MAAGGVDEERRRALVRGIAVAGRGSERTLAAAAHGAIAFGFVGIGFILSLVITAVIWLSSWKSTYVREQSDRAGRYQIFVLLVNILVIALWSLGLGLLLWLTGWRFLGLGGDSQVARSLPIALVIVLDLLLLVIAVPVFVVWYFGSIIYGVYGAARALAGHDFHYPPPPWAWRKRKAQAVRADDDADDDPANDEDQDGEPEVVDEVLKRKLKWED